MAQLSDSYRGPGIRVRFSRLRGETSRRVLRRALYLPCVLGDLEVTEEFAHTDYDTPTAGEFSTPDSTDVAARSLRGVDLETLVVDWHRFARWTHNPGLSPAEARNEIDRIGRAKTPFEVLATEQITEGAPSWIRWAATLRSVTYTLKPGEADTRYIRLELREWRDPAQERVGAGGKRGSAGRRKLPATVTITKETTLRSLTRTFFGSDASISTIAKAICTANRLGAWRTTRPLHEHPRLKVGSKIKVPDVKLGEVLQVGPTTVAGIAPGVIRGG